MFRSIAITLALCFAAVTAQAALLGRAALTPGGSDYQAYYDDVLNITWLADANLADTNDFGVTNYGGKMHWVPAQSWLGAMNAANYLGASNWRLPTMNWINGSSVNGYESYDGSTDFGWNISAPGTLYAGSTASEMAHLFYNTLGNVGEYDVSGAPTGCSGTSPWCLTNTGPFVNLMPASDNSCCARGYWAGSPTDVGNTWVGMVFSFGSGRQTNDLKNGNSDYVWAVSDGDMLAPVPAPPAVWLFGSALGLMGWMRRKATA